MKNERQGTTKVQVTPEMREAGYQASFNEHEDIRDTCEDIYRAMEKAKAVTE